ncbi:MAG TPA: hypothetical protein VEI97_13730 [bacterium]|nr:hypothetical protein [bacterium]
MRGYYTFVAQVQGQLPLSHELSGRAARTPIAVAVEASDGAPGQRLIDLAENVAAVLAEEGLPVPEPRNVPLVTTP